MVITKDKLKVKILENNNEVRSDEKMQTYSFLRFQVLPILIRDIGKHLTPDEDIVLVRFDTYANLLVPKDVQADEIETLDHLIEYVERRILDLLKAHFLVQSIIKHGFFQLFIVEF